MFPSWFVQRMDDAVLEQLRAMAAAEQTPRICTRHNERMEWMPCTNGVSQWICRSCEDDEIARRLDAGAW